eukprot:m.101420 g.101420  ORF g.101420 m.101420 type:complete len:836 (+) comp14089_c0_seq6:47-2554(+)
MAGEPPPYVNVPGFVDAPDATKETAFPVRHSIVRVSELGAVDPHGAESDTDMNDAPNPPSRSPRSHDGGLRNYQNAMNALPSNTQFAREQDIIRRRSTVDFGTLTAAFLNAKDEDDGSASRSHVITNMRRHTGRMYPTTLNRRRSTAGGVKYIDVDPKDEMNEATKNIARVKTMAAPLGMKIQAIKEEERIAAEALQQLGFCFYWHAIITQSIISSWRHFQTRLRGAKPWEDHIKMLTGRHGAAVGTYFTFVRWTLFFNLFIALLWSLFVVVPYAIEFGFEHSKDITPAVITDYSTTETLIGLATGGAQLNHSAYFIGSYFIPGSSGPLGSSQASRTPRYNLPLAYLLVCGAYLFISFILFFRQVYWATFQRAAVLSETENSFSELVLCSHDHNVMSVESAALRQISLVQQIRESLSEQRAKLNFAQTTRIIIFKRILVNILVVLLLSGALYIVQLSVTTFTSKSNELTNFVPPLILSFFNLAAPILFEELAKIEQWHTDLFVLQLTVLRSLILRSAGLFVFFYTIFMRRTSYMCWESFVGQYVYNLFIILMVVEFAVALLRDPLKNYCRARFEWIRKNFQAPVFQTTSATIELVYGQSITLFGTFFCPLLPALGVLRCIISFYIHRFNTLHACQPPLTAFKARYSFTELFFVVMLVMLFLVAFPLGYAITRLPTSGAYMSDSTNQFFMSVPTTSSIACNTTTPSCAVCLNSFNASASVCWMPNDAVGVLVSMSQLCQACPSGCGPFRNQESIYATALKEFDTWSPDAQASLRFIGTASFAAIVILILLMGWFYLHAKVRASTSLVERLRMERDSERTDKMWILEKYAIILDDHR